MEMHQEGNLKPGQTTLMSDDCIEKTKGKGLHKTFHAAVGSFLTSLPDGHGWSILCPDFFPTCK
jgi:hypothetical protein